MEIELKFQLPHAAIASLADTLRVDGANTQPMRARYVDTDLRDLARAGFALRLRREGTTWVQTLKSAPTFASSVRAEHNAVLGDDMEPGLDPGRHGESEEGRRLLALLAQPGMQALACQFETDIERLALVREEYGATIEYALDRGVIKAGSLSIPVAEIEIELVSGPPAALLSAGRALVDEHGAWLDVRSKAMRGDTLARGRDRVPPAVADGTSLKSCVSAVLVNASQVASDEGHDPQHLEQLRRGLLQLPELAARAGHRFDAVDLRVLAALSEHLATSVSSPAAAVRNAAVQHCFLHLVAIELSA